MNQKQTGFYNEMDQKSTKKRQIQVSKKLNWAKFDTKYPKKAEIQTYSRKMSLQFGKSFAVFQSTAIRAQIIQIIENTPFGRIAI